MAHISIATQTSLDQAMEEVRERTGSWSEADSELYRLALANLIHDAILLVRGGLARKDEAHRTELKNFYWTEAPETSETNNLIDISALDIWWDVAGIKGLTLYDDANGTAKTLTQAEFIELKTIYTTEMMADFFFAYVANIAEKFQLKTFRGLNLNPIGTLTLGYPRNPVKGLEVANKLDCTEEMVREAIELVIKWIPERLRAA